MNAVIATPTANEIPISVLVMLNRHGRIRHLPGASFTVDIGCSFGLVAERLS
jgi:hypothetical protein